MRHKTQAMRRLEKQTPHTNQSECTMQSEGSVEPVAWAVVLAGGERIYDVYSLEQDARAIDEAVTGQHGVVPLYRSPVCPYITGTVTRYCTLTPFTLTDKEREALKDCVHAYGLNDDDEECASIANTIRGLLERTSQNVVTCFNSVHKSDQK